MPLTSSEGDGQRLIRVLVSIASFITFVVVIACLYVGKTVLIPVALALLLTFLLTPVVHVFQRLGLGRTLSVLLVVLFTGIVVAGMAWVVTAQVTRLVYDLGHDTQYKAHIQQKLADFQGFAKAGALENFQELIKNIMGGLEQTAQPVASTEQPQVVIKEQSSFLATLQTLLSPLLAPLSAAAFVVVLVIFMLLRYEDLRNRLIGLVGAGRLTVTTKVLDDAGQRMSRYLLMQCIINGTYGVAIGLGLFFLGMPYAFLWGLLTAVLRYIPYVGPLIASVFPIILSLVAFPGWGHLGLVVGLFVLIELGSNLVMEPWLYSQSVGVSEVGLLVVTGFWTWLWGPVGLILATPLTVCIVVLGRYVPQLQFFSMLLSDAPGLTPQMLYYQRLLARDQDEATELVEDYIKTNTLEKVYDDVLIPGLLFAWEDRDQSLLTGESEAFILQATQTIIVDLGHSTLTESHGEQAGNNAMAEAVPSQTFILGVPAHHEAEEVVIQMFQQLMQPAGCRVEVISTRTHVSDLITRIKQESPALIFIAALPGGLPQTCYLCEHLHEELPTLPVVVGYWGEKEDFDENLVRLRQAGANSLTTSLLQSRSRVGMLLGEGGAPPRVATGMQSPNH